MKFQSVDEAIRKLEDMSAGAKVHLEAIRYLDSMDECSKIDSLVHALQNEDFGVRWEAGRLLTKIGFDALPAILKALMDPQRVCDVHLREGVIHIVQAYQDPTLPGEFIPLLNALKGPAADIVTMREANLLLIKMGLKDCNDNT